VPRHQAAYPQGIPFKRVHLACHLRKKVHDLIVEENIRLLTRDAGLVSRIAADSTDGTESSW